MNKTAILTAILVWLIIGCGNDSEKEGDDSKYSGEKFSQHIRSTEARSPEEERLGFKLPPGFEIELYASEPDIGKPMNIAFDAKGRMWVTQSSDYPFPASPGKGDDHITILEDTDNDGKADRFTPFSDTLNIPIGILPLNDGAITYSIPNVTRFMDTDRNGKAESRVKLLGPFGYDDTHGMVNNMVRGYDGWVHACHGFNISTVAGADGDSIHMIYGNTFRFRLDGSRVEQTTFGRINPFGLVYDELGYLYSTDCHTSPLYQLIEGGDYTQWGKVPDIGFAPVMKPLEDEATALAGLAYYADTRFPEEYRKNFYIGDVVACRVYRNSSTFKGSSPVGKKEDDFVLSEDPWFRPVDVKMGPDGALYIADFYNSIIAHYEVPLDHPKRDKLRGRIWRITYKGDVNKPRDWTLASVEELLAALDMDNLSIRMTATDQLTDRIGQQAAQPVKALLNKKELSARAYIHGLWVLHRLNALPEDLIKKSATHPDPTIRIHTMRILAEKKDSANTFYPLLTHALNDENPHVQRAAIELLEKYPTISSLQSALSIRDNIPDYDSHLLYTTRLILRNLLRNQHLFQRVISKEWEQKDANYLADVMVGVPASEAGMFLLNYVDRYSLPAGNTQTAFQHIARYIPHEQLDRAVNIALQKKGNDIDTEFQIFKGMQQGIAQRGGKENTQLIEWGKALAKSLLEKHPSENPMKQSGGVLSQQNFAVELAGKYKVGSLEPAVRAFVEDTTNLNVKEPDWDTFIQLRAALDLKVAALRALLQIAPENNAALVKQILQDEHSPMDFRKRTAALLGDFPGPAMNEILGSVKNIPADLQADIVLSLASTSAGKDIVLQQVKAGELLPRILTEPRVEERILLNISSMQRKEFDALTANLVPISKEKDSLIFSRLIAFNEANAAVKEKQALAESGQQVFLRNCSSCHKIGNEGGSIGPNLDGIGEWGANALAGKILDPNRNISEAFRNYTIRLKDGKVMSGLYRRDEGEILVFADMTGKEFSVSKKNIAEQVASKYTLMPDHFGKVISQDDFNALLTYLLGQKS